MHALLVYLKYYGELGVDAIGILILCEIWIFESIQYHDWRLSYIAYYENGGKR